LRPGAINRIAAAKRDLNRRGAFVIGDLVQGAC
jgi:hypothetical protein